MNPQSPPSGEARAEVPLLPCRLCKTAPRFVPKDRWNTGDLVACYGTGCSAFGQWMAPDKWQQRQTESIFQVAAIVDETQERREFEEQAFHQYFISSIEKTGLGGCLTFMPTEGLKLKKDFCARDAAGLYIEPGLEPAWWGWLARAGRAQLRGKG